MYAAAQNELSLKHFPVMFTSCLLGKNPAPKKKEKWMFEGFQFDPDMVLLRKCPILQYLSSDVKRIFSLEEVFFTLYHTIPTFNNPEKESF